MDLSGIEDENGLPTTFQYQWKKSSGSIPGARGPTFTVTADEVTARLRVTVSFTDGDGNAETVTSIDTHPVSPAPVNTPPTGLPSISGTAHVGETLAASASGIADADGLSGATFTYQWTRSDGTTDTDIADATQASYTLVSADQGKTIKVRATFIDDGGTEETLVSAATVAVEATVPDAPREVAIAVPNGQEGVLEVSWEAPGSDGGSAITGYKVQWKSGSEEYDGTASSTRQATVTDLANLTYPITGLTNGVAYTVRVIATNAVGDGAETADAVGTPRDRVRPELATAVVNGEALVLTWSEALDAGSKPAADAFAVSVAGVAREVAEVAVSGNTVALTLASAVMADDVVTVGYTVPAAPDAARIEDAAGNAAAGFSGEVVTNNTAAPVNTPPTGLPTISGTAHVGETLTASVSEIADADGLSGATFAWQWIANDGTGDTDISGATEASYTLGAADEGKTVRVRVRFTDGGGTEETLVSAATEPVAVPLTARFEDVPETHDGSTRFTFDLRFSEEIPLSYKTLRDRSLEVSGGTVRGARRLARPSNMLWRITVDPDTEGDLTITPAGGPRLQHGGGNLHLGWEAAVEPARRDRGRPCVAGASGGLDRGADESSDGGDGGAVHADAQRVPVRRADRGRGGDGERGDAERGAARERDLRGGRRHCRIDGRDRR